MVTGVTSTGPCLWSPGRRCFREPSVCAERRSAAGSSRRRNGRQIPRLRPQRGAEQRQTGLQLRVRPVTHGMDTFCSHLPEGTGSDLNPFVSLQVAQWLRGRHEVQRGVRLQSADPASAASSGRDGSEARTEEGAVSCRGLCARQQRGAARPHVSPERRHFFLFFFFYDSGSQGGGVGPFKRLIPEFYFCYQIMRSKTAGQHGTVPSGPAHSSGLIQTCTLPGLWPTWYRYYLGELGVSSQ